MVILFSSVHEDEPPDADDFRLRHFPDKPIGKIDFYALDSMFHISSSSSGVVAKGEVKFPNGMNADMEIFGNACGDLSGLDCLGPDDLSTIRFFQCHVEDFQLKHLQHLTGLQCLDLKDTNVSEFGLFFLQSLNGLCTIILDNTQTNDQGLRYLPVSNLRNLYLKRTQITDEGIFTLRDMPGLKNISLPSTITDKGIEALAGAVLEDLDITDCKLVTADCFKYLQQIPDLKDLCLPDQITDAELPLLTELNIKFKNISFSPQTSTTKEARELLQSNGTAVRVMVCMRC